MKYFWLILFEITLLLAFLFFSFPAAFENIAPDNIFLHTFEQGFPHEPLTAVLGDFGEAINFGPLREGQDDASRFSVPYFPGYNPGGAAICMAPEVVNNTSVGKVMDYAKNDVFALGMAAYHALTGGDRPDPFGTCNQREYTAENYRPLPECYDADVREVVRRAVHPEAAHRYSAAELEQAIWGLDHI